MMLMIHGYSHAIQRDGRAMYMDWNGYADVLNRKLVNVQIMIKTGVFLFAMDMKATSSQASLLTVFNTAYMCYYYLHIPLI